MKNRCFDKRGEMRIAFWELINQGDILCQGNCPRMSRFPKSAERRAGKVSESASSSGDLEN